MIFDRTNEQLSQWRNQMKQYEKGKRTKKPFGKSLPHTTHVTYEQVKLRESKFNPLLQTFKNKEDQIKADSVQEFNRVKSLMNHIKNVQKYEKNYDIINLYEYEGTKTEVQPYAKKTGPIRNAYNVINNQKLPDFYFKNKDLQLPQERQKTLLDYHKKEFDIITGQYKENNEQKTTKERQKENDQVIKKYWKTHDYDPVYGKFYDPSKEQEYRKQQTQREKQHGKDQQKKLPPSYINREPLILNFQKPLPETLHKLDEKEQIKKKKFQMKYLIQQEYEQRNLEQEDRQEKFLKNKIHDGRLLDEKSKQFDIITNQVHPDNRVDRLYGKKPKLANWEQYIKPVQNQPKLIKTSGFN